MSRFKDCTCPYCENAFTENDDIVVCPDCGTPHHRGCYMDNKACKNELLHGSGFEWKSPVEKAISGFIAEEEREISVNEARWQAFKETHGKEMDEEKLQSFQKFFSFEEAKKANSESTQKRFEERAIYGVSEREIMSFQNSGNPFMIDRYRRIAIDGKIISFNIFAGFLNPFYSFYFRAYPLAILFAVFNFIFNLPSLFAYLYNMNIVTNANTIAMVEQLYSKFGNLFLILSTGLMLTICMFFNYLYLKWMTGRIKTVRARFEENNTELGTEYYMTLAKIGRPSIIRGFVDNIIASAALTFAFLFILNIMKLT